MKHRVISPTVRAGEKVLSMFPLLANFYMRPYKSVVLKEIKLAKLKPGERVLQIGAGSIPFSAIYLAQLADVSVCAIDIDQYAVDRARKWIKKMGLTPRVQMKVADGRDFPPESFTAAFVALQAEPKKEIINYLLKKGKNGFRIVVRQPVKRLLSQYDGVPGNRPYQGKTEQRMATFSSSLLFVKGEA